MVESSAAAGNTLTLQVRQRRSVALLACRADDSGTRRAARMTDEELRHEARRLQRLRDDVTEALMSLLLYSTVAAVTIAVLEALY